MEILTNIFKILSELVPLFTIIALTFTMIALWLAYNQLRKAKASADELTTQSKQLQLHSDELIKIKETLSTSYIGEFPDFLSKINEIIQTAKDKISIVCDVPGYGIFSSPRLATEYRNKIRTKCSESVSISLMYYSKDRRSTNFQEQFDKTQWEEWRAESENLDKLKSFINRYARNKGYIRNSQLVNNL